ncbi:hypothetical protein STIAU_1363 [Stigmatella aurantiaca DW4/3-1]|uniref:Uncharacterized protein n=1 Tax=Stigmatella aurantiaca (strain DW4/3-1) TaxID=378806 RepID=Q08PA7_STIAD|nr:hypothetical protein STIAU_1363 [Stigmatella aurantiaca DW4/3-1]
MKQDLHSLDILFDVPHHTRQHVRIAWRKLAFIDEADPFDLYRHTTELEFRPPNVHRLSVVQQGVARICSHLRRQLTPPQAIEVPALEAERLHARPRASNVALFDDEHIHEAQVRLRHPHVRLDAGLVEVLEPPPLRPRASRVLLQEGDHLPLKGQAPGISVTHEFVARPLQRPLLRNPLLDFRGPRLQVRHVVGPEGLRCDFGRSCLLQGLAVPRQLRHVHRQPLPRELRLPLLELRLRHLRRKACRFGGHGGPSPTPSPSAPAGGHDTRGLTVPHRQRRLCLSDVASRLVKRQRARFAPLRHQAGRLPALLEVAGQLPHHALPDSRLQSLQHRLQRLYAGHHRPEPSPLPPGEARFPKGTRPLASRVQAHHEGRGRQLPRGLLVLPLGQRGPALRRPRRQVVEAQRHPEGEGVKGRQGHVARRESPQVLGPLHLPVRLPVQRGQLLGLERGLHGAASADEGNGGRDVIRDPSQPARNVARTEGSLGEVGEGQAPLLQFLAHPLHGPQGALEQLVLGQQVQQLPHLIVVGGVQHEEGEDFRLGYAVPLDSSGEESRALLEENAGGLGLQRAQGAQPDGVPVRERLHQPGHVRLPLQGQEGRRCGALEEGRQHLPLRVQVRPARGHLSADTCQGAHPTQGRRLASSRAGRRRGPAAVQERFDRGLLVIEVLKHVTLRETRDGTPPQGHQGRRARDSSHSAPRARPGGQRGTPHREERQGQHQAHSASRQSLSAHCPPPAPRPRKPPASASPPAWEIAACRPAPARRGYLPGNATGPPRRRGSALRAGPWPSPARRRPG